MGNSKSKRRKMHKRVLRAAVIAGVLLALGMYIKHEAVMLVAGGAVSAMFDLLFE